MTTPLFGLELPQLTDEQPPQTMDAASCRHWLSSLTGSSARQMQPLLLRQLNLLNRYQLPASERYQVLELLHSQVHAGRYECAVRFTFRPMPLAPPEQAAFDTEVALWQALYIGYLHCLQEFIDTASSATAMVRQQVATAACRAMACLQYTYSDNSLAAMLPPSNFWLQLHRLYRVLEKMRLATVVVEDPQRPQFITSVTTLYVETLLLAAAYPLELHPLKLVQVMHWARQWSARITLLPAPPQDLRTPPLDIDLTADQPGIFKAQPQAGAQRRWLDMAGLRISLKQMLAALDKGEEPDSLRQRTDLSLDSCTQLLRQVYQDWCRGGRRTSIKRGGGRCQLVIGIEAIHYYCSGEVFREPDAQAHDIPNLTLDEQALTTQYLIESWQELGGNINELLVRRPLQQEGRRLMRSQLVALRSSDDEHLRLGKVQWIAIDSPREYVLTGMAILPGMPQAVTLHTPGIGGVKAQYARGFVLPNITELQLPASLLVPPGWFQPGHQLALIQGTQRQMLRLLEKLDSGADFERCRFELI